jgi:hypothetical protein
MKRSRNGCPVALALIGATLLGGCAVVTASKDGPPPHAPAYGLRAKKPPKLTVAPAVVVISGTQVSYASNHPEDLFFYQGRWWRPYDGQWYWAVTVGGDWTDVTLGEVPKAVLEIPNDYREKRGGPPHAPARGVKGKKKS